MRTAKPPTMIDVLAVADRSMRDRNVINEFIETYIDQVEGAYMASLLMLVRSEYAEWEEAALVSSVLLIITLQMPEALATHDIKLTEVQLEALCELVNRAQDNGGRIR